MLDKVRYTIGITMRVTNAPNYSELRDTIAQDWSNYLNTNFKDDKWLFIPNLGKESVKYITKFNVNVLFFSGGEDIGASPCRDKTEKELLQHAIKNNIPVVAICRGLQFVYDFFGGHVHQGSSEFKVKHVASQHQINLNGSQKEVNSFHGNYLEEETLPNGFKVIARSSEDNTIEAVEYQNILGIMWHPEREIRSQLWETDMIRSFLKKHYLK